MIAGLNKYYIVSRSLARYERSVLVFLFSLNFVVSFRVFNNTLLHAPGKIIETIYLPIIALYIGIRVINRIVNNDYRLNGFHIMYVIYLLLPVLPAISAQVVWEQPFYLGFISFRQFYLIGGALLIYNLVVKNPESIVILEKAMIIIAWLVLVLFFLTSTFADPAQFLDSRIVTYSANRGGILIFKFNMGFIFFGTIYYFVKYFKTQKSVYILGSLLFLSYILFVREDRSSMIAVLGTLLVFFVLNINIKKQVLYAIGITIPLIALLIIINKLYPAFLERYALMFRDIGYALTGEANPDVGQSVRIYETQIARSLIEKSPIIGNGKLSNAFIEGGWNALYYYFFPSDIGLIGTVFTYGIPGAIIMYSQFGFAIYWISKVKYFKNNVFFLSCCYYLLVLFIDSLSNGYLTVFAAQSLSTITVIYLFYLFDKRLSANLT